MLFSSVYISSNIAVIISKIGIEQDYLTFIRYSFLIISLAIMGFSSFLLNTKEKYFLAFTLSSCVLTLYFSHSTWSILLLSCSYLCIYCKRIEIKDLAKSIFISNCILFLFAIMFIFLSDVWGSFDPRYGIRVTYGFTSPNIPAMYMLSFYISVNFFLHYIVRNKSISILFSTFAFIISYSLIDPTISRTSLGFLFISYILYLMTIFFDWWSFKKIYSIFTVVFVSFVAVFQLYVAFNYNSALSGLNILLSNRIGLSSMLYQAVGYPKFLYGIDIEPYTPLDFFFIAYFYSTGWFCGVFYFYIFMKKLLSTKINIVTFGILLSCLLSTITERQFLIPLCSVALFIVFSKSRNHDAGD